MAVTDPYKVLGVSPNASEEEVKSAYRQLVKKYHPDNYADSPLADLANEKMQEVNEAYDMVMNRLRAGGQNGSSQQNAGYAGGNPYGGQQAGYGYNGGYGYGGQASGQQSDIRRLIQQNRLVEAEELLDGIPVKNRDGEWYFLKGTIFFQRGWLDDAMNHFSTACRLNPNNPEYRAAMNRMMWQQQGNMGSPNGSYRTGPDMAGMNACNCCSNLICADCCCECMGGDLIPCC
ncbi:MAG TPA: DnaJ domain-containing protein [Candidatus Merdivicinus excrementipullorum]|uniref:DnaJ domain-containing protein n=1 Tax=Candidatus Merdivicinus excrementipullorum TaxID=2840867 RepID=A0A9D1FKJ9_9FIRM|nr:DnaJ domain-containing protein [Candidatus Merdivicinus excrementipullorum]